MIRSEDQEQGEVLTMEDDKNEEEDNRNEFFFGFQYSGTHMLHIKKIFMR